MTIPSYENAPLNEVELILWWHVTSFADFNRSERLIEDLQKELDKTFDRGIDIGQSFPEFNLPSRPFSTFEFVSKTIPEIRLTLTNESLRIAHLADNYKWENLYDHLNSIIDGFLIILTKTFREIDHLHIGLDYDNYIENPSGETVGPINFLNEKFNAKVEHGLSGEKDVKDVSFLTKYNYEDEGTIQVLLSNKERFTSPNGLSFRLKAESKKMSVEKKIITGWVERARINCLEIFEETCSEELKKSFQPS